MRYAIISDIHANWQAWSAVRDDIMVQDVDCSLCLGDVIGYGPQPQRVLDDVRLHSHNFVLGNHDAVVCGKIDPALFNDRARHVIDWTCQQLDDDASAFFGGVSMLMGDDAMLCAHAEIAMPSRWSYIFEAEQARVSFEASKAKLMFVGHTHKPILCRYNQGALDGVLGSGIQPLDPDWRYLINVGSVGDPRDGLPTASYCIYDDEQQTVEFRRLGFDYSAFKDDLERSKLPVRPMFLDCIGEVSSAATQVMQAPDMAIDKTPQEMPVASGHQTHTVKIRMQKRNRKRRIRARSRTDINTAQVMPEAPPPADNKKAIIAACVVLAVLLIGLVFAIGSRRSAPANPAVATAPVDSGKVAESATPAVDDPLPPVNTGSVAGLEPTVVIPPAITNTSLLENPVRFIRIEVENGACSLVEVEAYGADGVANLARGKSATQSSDRAGRVAGRAVDGRVATARDSGTVAHTNLGQSSWWEVDLGADEEIVAVRIWNVSGTSYRDMENYIISARDSSGVVHWRRMKQPAPKPDNGSTKTYYPTGVQAKLPKIQDETATVAKAPVAAGPLDLETFRNAMLPAKNADWPSGISTLRQIGTVGREEVGGVHAMSFDGQSSFAVDGADTVTYEGGFTVGAMVRVRDASVQQKSYAGIVTRSDNSWRLSFKNGSRTLHFAYANKKKSVMIDAHGTSIGDGNWHYVVGVVSYRERVMRLYLDGELIQSEPMKNGALPKEGSPIIIGGGKEKGREFTGWLARVAVWDRPLGESRIKAITDTGLAGAEVVAAAPVHDAGFGENDDELLVYEGFNYPVTGTTNLDGGYGWSKEGWTRLREGMNAKVVAGSLPDQPSAISATPTYVQITPDSRYGRGLDCSADGPLGKAGLLDEEGRVGADGKTVYLSCFIRSPANRYFEFELHRGNLDDPGRIGGIGNEPGPVGYYLRAGDRDDIQIGGEPNKTQFYVMRIDYKAELDDVRVYHNPKPGAEPAAAAASHFGGADMSFDGISLGVFGSGTLIELDEIRIGTTFESVVPAVAGTTVVPSVAVKAAAVAKPVAATVPTPVAPTVSKPVAASSGALPVVLTVKQSKDLFDLSGKTPHVVYVKFRSTTGGTLFAATVDGEWKEGSRAVFLENGTIQYEMNGVGRAGGGKGLNDGEWHELFVRMGDAGGLMMYVDGELISQRPNSSGAPLRGAVASIGRATKVSKAFAGDVAAVRYLKVRLNGGKLKKFLESGVGTFEDKIAFRWDAPKVGAAPGEGQVAVAPTPVDGAIVVEDVALALLNKDWALAKKLAAGDAKTAALIERALGARARLTQSFKDKVGSEVAVKFPTGLEVVEIRSVHGTRVQGASRGPNGLRPKSFEIFELPNSEQERLLGVADPATSLYFGLLQSAKGDLVSAARDFRKSRSELGQVLVAQAKALYLERKETIAEKGFVAVLSALGLDCSSGDYEAIIANARGQHHTGSPRTMFLRLATEYPKRYGHSEFGKKHVPALQELAHVVKVGRLPGLHGAYYRGKFEGEPIHAEPAAKIDFSWDRAKPAEGVPADNFSIRWTGFLKVPKSAKYAFQVSADDGATLWIDKKQVKNGNHIELAADKEYAIRLDYFENTRGAHVKLAAGIVGQATETIPESYLFHIPKTAAAK